MRTALLFAFLATATLHAEEEKTHDITVQIKLNCPNSPELAAFVTSIPDPGQHMVTFEEWKTSFLNSMNHLVDLIESEQVNNCHWSAGTEEHQAQQ